MVVTENGEEIDLRSMADSQVSYEKRKFLDNFNMSIQLLNKYKYINQFKMMFGYCNITIFIFTVASIISVNAIAIVTVGQCWSLVNATSTILTGA